MAINNGATAYTYISPYSTEGNGGGDSSVISQALQGACGVAPDGEGQAFYPRYCAIFNAPLTGPQKAALDAYLLQNGFVYDRSYTLTSTGATPNPTIIANDGNSYSAA